jgi:hypothetical protein
MADKAARDIEAMHIRDKDRDDSERRDEVRKQLRCSLRLFFFVGRFFDQHESCQAPVPFPLPTNSNHPWYRHQTHD